MRRIIPLSFAFAAFTYSAQAELDLPQEVIEGMYITVSEVRSNSQAVFEAFAGDGDDRVTREAFVSSDLPPEVMSGEPDRKMLSDLFPKLDANDDGTLTQDEWNRRIERDLAFADENEDGRITLRELSNARENMGIGDALERVGGHARGLQPAFVQLHTGKIDIGASEFQQMPALASRGGTSVEYASADSLQQPGRRQLRAGILDRHGALGEPGQIVHGPRRFEPHRPCHEFGRHSVDIEGTQLFAILRSGGI